MGYCYKHGEYYGSKCISCSLDDRIFPVDFTPKIEIPKIETPKIEIQCYSCNGKGYTEWYHHHPDPCLSRGCIRDKCNCCNGSGYL